MNRIEISSNYKWNLSNLYNNIEVYYKDLELLDKKVKEFIKYKGIITENSNNLLKVLELHEQIDMIINKLYVYSNMSLHIDTTDSFYQELTGNLDITLSNINEQMSFFDPELLSTEYSKILGFINEENMLKRFNFFLEQLFNEREHVLSLKEEEILSRCSNVLNASDTIFSNLNDADIIFDSITDEYNNKLILTKGTYYKYIISKNRDIRKNAFINLYSKYKELNNTFANIMNTNLQTTNFLYKTRKYKSVINMYLDGNKIDLKIYYDLINAVNENLDKLYKYFNIRKNVLKYDELHMYDLSVDLIDNEFKEYNYEEATNLVLESAKVLGETYVLDLKKAFNENWIDVYETKGKKSGAYSWGCYPNHPYVLLNFQNRLDDVSTIAHELGHALHRYYSNNNQDYYYSDNEIFVAEIASTVNELLLKFYLLNKSTNNNEKLNIINDLIDSVKNTIYRQTMFAEFELTIHNMSSNNEALTASKLNAIYYDLVKKYHGTNVIIDEEIKYEWSRIPHFYTPFYVYQYATGLSVAFVIANKIFKGDTEMKMKYLEFLKSGSKDYPTNLVSEMGIDIKSSVNEALIIFNNLIEEFELLL